MADRKIEIINLAEETIRNIELDEIPLQGVIFRCARLARLVGNQDYIDLFTYELSGYPKNSEGYIENKAFGLSRILNRPYKQKDKDGVEKEYMMTESVTELASQLSAATSQMAVAQDKDISLSSANPYQSLTPTSNNFERHELRRSIIDASKKMNKLKNGYYNFVLNIYAKYKLEDITEDIFKRKKALVDKILSDRVPKAIQKFVAVYENLKSENNEDWSNAVHSCRRIMKDVSDMLYPATDKEISTGEGKTIKLSDENYIVRLKQYIKEHCDSDKFLIVVGSHLDFIGDRIDALYRSSNKGTHDIVNKEEAERYVIYTYLLLADILSL